MFVKSLIERPKILIMANQMFDALDTPLDLPFVIAFTETVKSKTTLDIEKSTCSALFGAKKCNAFFLNVGCYWMKLLKTL
jgi:hypothetical protein